MKNFSLFLRNVATRFACLAVLMCVAVFTNAIAAQTTFTYTDASGVTAKYNTVLVHGQDCPYGNCVYLEEIITIPNTTKTWIIPETVTNGGTTYYLREITSTIFGGNYPQVEEIIMPNSVGYCDAVFGNMPNLRKFTYGKNVRNFGGIYNVSLDTLVFLGVNVIDDPGYGVYLNGSFIDVYANKVIIPCGSMALFKASMGVDYDGETAAFRWGDYITAANLEEAECLNILTVLSSDVTIGHARSYRLNGGLLTSTPDNTSIEHNGGAELLAIPKSGVVFTGWNDGNVDNPRLVTVDEDVTYTAIFAVCQDVSINNSHTDAKQMKVYPNPTNNVINVLLEKPVKNGTLTLFDMNGKIILSQLINGNTAKINMFSCVAGSYILLLSENGVVVSEVKIVKSK